MASLLARLFGLHEPPPPVTPAAPRAPILPTSHTRLIAQPASPAPLKNWCHPFKSNLNPLMQLTHLAKAAGGYYPIGRSGLFHGGIHFDAGTAGTLDQSSVRCLADGEVVAYRIDTHAPTTRYFIGELTIDKPFSRNFVLVRHRLQPPRIIGSADIPPSLTFYSLYMHLQDWAKYEQNDAIERPGFWPASPTLRVPQTAKDVRPGPLEQRGLNVRHQPTQGKIIDLLPRGALVTVSGSGAYRKLENRLGPAVLITADGALAGYIAVKLLRPVRDNEYRITSSEPAVNVRAGPSLTSKVLFELPTGSVVTVSGEGDFRKLERVNQYVHFASLQSELAPLATDRVVVLDQPVPIQAGASIGHIGEYQSMGADRPEEKLHLEVFTGDDVDLFLDASRDWAKRLPAKERTWLKLVKGTPVVPHEEWVTAARLQAASDASPRSAADLLVPKSLLDGLPAEGKIHVPATDYRKARNWYRLDGLLHDADHNLLDGWVCEEVDATPWVSPWSWEGYEVIFDYSTPRHEMASFFSAVGRFNEGQRERFRPLAEKSNQGPMKSRLNAILDRNGDDKITAEEVQAALQLPALAQSISQMVLRKESEWFHQTQKWDALDELLGHSGSTPHWNWQAEKQRIEQISWWSEVAEKVGLPSWGRPYHFHPIGLLTRLNNDRKKCYCYQQGLVGTPCDLGVTDVTKNHFELLADELGVEREVLRAIAVAETGDKAPFREYEPGKRHALILYERHYMRRLLLASGMSQYEVNALSMSEPKIVHVYEASYVYGSLDEQYSRLKRAREINDAAAVKSCSWGKFQVMGEYYRHLYSNIEELEEAQNYCALQHLQYFKVFLVEEKKLIGPMRSKDWLQIAQKYNGKGQIGYDVKIRSAYEKLKQNW
ncbi:N-acetylmuramidase domain-containing protein [Pseudomonas sp. PDM31]|uniref:N-acetylmuramidase domain-containing protein n=1 Tax=Pseudomonas sp. PDM31 TaxID=2854778 RepID=UPI001C437537|nr:N-acetylmuramidase domain-containing protein [Pseudomonas sp. PDM31]MBV7477385.1 DUF3380 domain-containing protein [Pseudomonas sp. PDM31]